MSHTIKNIHGFDVGQTVVINGEGILDGLLGTVVDYDEVIARARKDPGVVAYPVYSPKPGLVPVYVHEYSSTYFWWCSPLRLTKVKSLYDCITINRK